MGFSADWLALREPADRAARDAALMSAAAAAAGTAPVILDLGCGTGATRRALAASLPRAAQWRLVDNDPALLALATATAAEANARTFAADLTDLEALPWDGVTLVTCSALLDLVSEAWLDRLAATLADRRLPFYAALTYDGTMHWAPGHPDDDAVTAAFNRHQRGDKGFGPALGPEAAAAAVARLSAAGHAPRTADSPWRLDRHRAALQVGLIDGVAAAVAELQGANPATAASWAAARRDRVADTVMVVGHRDILALPGGA